LEETFSATRSTYAVDTQLQRQASIITSQPSRAPSTPIQSSSAPDDPSAAESNFRHASRAMDANNGMEDMPVDDVPHTPILHSTGTEGDVQERPPIVTLVCESTTSTDEPLFLSEEEVDAPASPLPLKGISSALNGDSIPVAAARGPRNRSPEVPIPSLPVPRVLDKSRPIEVVVSTTKASWNLRRAFEEHNSDNINTGRETKRLKLTRTSEQQPSGIGKTLEKADSGFEARFSRFARPGSQLPAASKSDAVEEEDELDYDENQQPTRSTKARQTDVDKLSDSDLHNSGNRVKRIFRREEPTRSTTMTGKDGEPASHHNRNDEEQAMDLDAADDRKLSDGPVTKISPMGIIDLTQENENQVINVISKRGSKRDNSGSTDPILEDESSVLSSEPSSAVSREIIRTRSSDADVTLVFDLSTVKKKWDAFQTHMREAETHRHDDSTAEAEHAAIRNAGVDIEDENRATDALSRVIDKSDFNTMRVVGQFNLGFIITRRIKEGDNSDMMDDLFIVDQHAADEKYNFETLQQTTKIDSQKLFQ
jgi:DNA mismatch repair protein PMS2